MDQVKRGFVTPDEVIDYFRQKDLLPSFSWRDVSPAEHAHNFTVAKAVEAELLGIFKDGIDEALAGGWTFDRWAAHVRAKMAAGGWGGPRLVKDPSGIEPARVVDFSSDRRLKTIFQSNMRAARAAGHWQRIQRTKRALPYILYVGTASVEPRLEHVNWHGIILPADDPFWDTHFPPNGWGCKCFVRQITAREAQGLGYNPDDPAPAPDITMREMRNRRTGAIEMVPAGIDPGWQSNPGKARARQLTSVLGERLTRVGPAAADRMVRQFWDSPERRVLANLPDAGISLPAGVREDLAVALAARGALVSVFADTVRGKIAKGQTRAAALDRLPDIIAEGVIADENRPGARTVFWSDGKRWWLAVVAITSAQYMRILTFYQIKASEAQRRTKQ